jgi:hypothetical protein
VLSGRDPVDDGDVWNAGTLSLTQSTVSGNFAGHYGYGAYFGDAAAWLKLPAP